MKALVLCAGFGTRLGDLTRDTPKPLLPLAGEPLLAHTLRYLSSNGFSEIAINLHYHADQIRQFVGDGSAFGVRTVLVEEAEPLGTAGAVRNLRSFFQNEQDFLVLYGDLLIDQDLKAMLAFHRSRKADGTLLLHQRTQSNSIVRIDDDGRITELVERPSDPTLFKPPFFVNSGVYVLTQAVFDAIPDGASDFPKTVFPAMLRTGKPLYGFPLSGYRCAIDSESRYREADAAMVSGACRRLSSLQPKPKQ